ncbi:hypothetical protein BKA69DRAFT_1103776 [Paraphysoderma sedebokerense]|nr:hypothetical protein BKA69DRAFT_1103776 [Paraphysoderma sedebokerense]
MDRFEWSDSDDESSSSINQKPLSNGPTTKCNVGSATDKKASTKDNTSPIEKCISNKVSPKDSSPVLQAKTDMNSSKKEHILPTKECAITNPTPEDSSPVPQAKMELNSSKKEQISPTNECIKSNTSPEDSSPIPLADMDIKLSNKEGILLTKECTSDKVITDNSSPVPPAVTPTMPESQQTSDTNNGPSSTTDMHMSSVALRIEKLKLLTDDVKARVGPSIEDPLFFALLVEIERLYSDTKKHKIKGRDHKEVAADSQQTANSTEQATKDSSNVGNHKAKSLLVTPDGCRDKSEEKSRNNVSVSPVFLISPGVAIDCRLMSICCSHK